MKRILNRIFSVALAAAMTTSPVLAQTAKKATAAEYADSSESGSCHEG